MKTWQATEYGLELSDGYALAANGLHEVWRDRGGIYGNIMHIGRKGWKDHDLAQFVGEWRRAMVMHGYKIDKAAFERTIGVLAEEAAERLATKILERLDDETHRPESLDEDNLLGSFISYKEMAARADRIAPILKRVLA